MSHFEAHWTGDDCRDRHVVLSRTRNETLGTSVARGSFGIVRAVEGPFGGSRKQPQAMSPRMNLLLKGPYIPVGAASVLVGTHALTNSWGTAWWVLFGIAIATAGLVALFVLRARRRRMYPDAPLPRVAWGSRVLAVVCSLLGGVFLLATLGAGLSQSQRWERALVGVALTAVAVAAASGRLTRARRRLVGTLPVDHRIRALSLTFNLLGAVLLLCATAGYQATTSMREHGVRAAATITAVTDYRAHNYFLEYELPSGRVAHCSTENVRGTHYAGQELEVLYDSSHPSTGCQSADFGTRYTFAYVCLGIGLVSVISGCTMWYRHRRPRPSETADNHPGTWVSIGPPLR